MWKRRCIQDAAPFMCSGQPVHVTGKSPKSIPSFAQGYPPLWATFPPRVPR